MEMKQGLKSKYGFQKLNFGSGQDPDIFKWWNHLEAMKTTKDCESVQYFFLTGKSKNEQSKVLKRPLILVVKAFKGEKKKQEKKKAQETISF